MGNAEEKANSAIQSANEFARKKNQQVADARELTKGKKRIEGGGLEMLNRILNRGL